MLPDQTILLLWCFQVSRKGNSHAIHDVSENKKTTQFTLGANVCLIIEPQKALYTEENWETMSLLDTKILHTFPAH